MTVVWQLISIVLLLAIVAICVFLGIKDTSRRPLRAIDNKLKRFLWGMIALIPFIIFAVFSKQYLRDYYLFEWMYRNSYAYVWVIAIIGGLVFFAAGLFISLYDIAAIAIAQVIGERIKAANASKITENMSAEEIHRLQSHPAFQIWVCLMLLCMIILIAVHFCRKSDEKPEL